MATAERHGSRLWAGWLASFLPAAAIALAPACAQSNVNATTESHRSAVEAVPSGRSAVEAVVSGSAAPNPSGRTPREVRVGTATAGRTVLDGCQAGLDLEVDRVTLADGLSSRCVAGMRPVLTTSRDVASLAEEPIRFSLPDPAGCIRALIVAERATTRTTMRLARGVRELHRAELGSRFVWLGADGPFCLAEAGDYVLYVSAAPSSRVEVRVWQAL